MEGENMNGQVKNTILVAHGEGARSEVCVSKPHYKGLLRTA